MLGTLFLGSSWNGTIGVQSAFGQGWCQIVYSSGSLAAVLATRPI